MLFIVPGDERDAARQRQRDADQRSGGLRAPDGARSSGAARDPRQRGGVLLPLRQGVSARQLWKSDTWSDNLRISFGKMLAPKFGGDAQLEQAIDSMIEDDYRNNL